MMYEKRTLIPHDSHKSYYGKAWIVRNDNGYYLVSYCTAVCMIDNNGHFKRIWQGYSATTMRHINSFLVEMGHDTINKAAWCNM